MLEKLLNEIDKLQREINAYRPLDKHLLKSIKEYYRIGLTYSSNALEGNSLTENETKIVIEDGITIGGKPLRDHFEAIGHSQAFDFIYNFSKTKSINENTIKKIHKLFYNKIDINSAGKYRKIKSYITGSKYKLPAPQEIPLLMKNFVNSLDNMKAQNHPVVYSALLHKEFVFIHPFIDGNGRTARLLMNLALLNSGYNIVIIPPVIRNEYGLSLEKAHKDDNDFILLIARMIKETQKDYLRIFTDKI